MASSSWARRRSTISVIRLKESAERSQGCAPVRVLQVVAQPVQLPVTLRLALGRIFLQEGRAVLINHRLHDRELFKHILIAGCSTKREMKVKSLVIADGRTLLVSINGRPL